MTKFYILIVIASHVIFSHDAHAQWSPPSMSKDEMTDKIWSWTELMNSTPPRDYADHTIQEITIRCRNQKFEIIGHTNGYVGSNNGKIEYRAGNLNSKTITTSVSTTGRAYFITEKNAINFANDMLSNSEIRINAYNYQGTPSFSRFYDADKNREAVISVASMCNILLK